MSTQNTNDQELPTWKTINARQQLIDKITLIELEHKRRRRFADQDLKMRRAAADSTAAVLASYVVKGILKPSEVPA